MKNKWGRKWTRLCVSKLTNFSSICLNMGMKFVSIERMDYLKHYLYVIQSKWWCVKTKKTYMQEGNFGGVQNNRDGSDLWTIMILPYFVIINKIVHNFHWFKFSLKRLCTSRGNLCKNYHVKCTYMFLNKGLLNHNGTQHLNSRWIK